MQNENDKNFVENILKEMLRFPEDVRVRRSTDEMGILIEVQVNKADMATLIGVKGQNVNAIRTLLRIVGSKSNARCNLKVIEPSEPLI